MPDDIVDLLRMGSTGCNCGAWSYSECGCHEAQWSEMYIDAAADEIERWQDIARRLYLFIQDPCTHDHWCDVCSSIDAYEQAVRGG